MPPRELAPSELRWICRPSEHDLSGAERDQSLIGIIGQERAIKALRLGIELYSPGYNIFVCASKAGGTGRASSVQKILNRIKGYCPLPPDRCYVHNFTKSDEPRLLELPRGCGEQLRSDMRRFSKAVQADLQSLLESEEHGKKRERIVSKYEGEGDRIIEKFERRAEREGFALKRVREGNVSRPELFPVLHGQATPIGDLERMVTEGKVPQRKAETIARQYQGLRQNLEETARRSRDLLSRMESEISDLEKKEARNVLQQRAEAMLRRYPADTAPRLAAYLQEVTEYLLERLDLFRRQTLSASPSAGATSGADESEDDGRSARHALQRLLDLLRVNVIFDSRRQEACPVVVETHPSYRRLFGYFEKALDPSGHWTSDFSRVRSGSLLAADGGYLVLTAEDLFEQRDVWAELKRTLISRSLSIHEELSNTLMPTVTLKPQPIPINIKVILIGHRELYEELLEHEPDFRKIFKVLAEFDEEMKLSDRTVRQYAAFIRRLCTDESLGEFEPGAVAAVIEYGARLAGHQGKLSTRFGDIADLLREADYWRRQQGERRRVSARNVLTAVEEARRRRSLTEEKLRELIESEQIRVEVTGRRVGQVNGLIVHDTGSHMFGLPARITATVSPGTAGIINIERESMLSGRSHTKGVLIIGGYLREQFGAGKPITLTASLAFEQSHGGIDGDSASITEVFALLSALSGAAVDQGIAVTGSVDQKGSIQPVGGINDKIEGFFKVCLSRGLTGAQGVVVPSRNLRDLMLSDEVVQAVRRRRFHIWPVAGVAEGIEILTGIPAGLPGADGAYPEDSIFGRVDARLRHFNDVIRRYPAPPPM